MLVKLRLILLCVCVCFVSVFLMRDFSDRIKIHSSPSPVTIVTPQHHTIEKQFFFDQYVVTKCTQWQWFNELKLVFFIYILLIFKCMINLFIKTDDNGSDCVNKLSASQARLTCPLYFFHYVLAVISAILAPCSVLTNLLKFLLIFCAWSIICQY